MSKNIYCVETEKIFVTPSAFQIIIITIQVAVAERAKAAELSSVLYKSSGVRIPPATKLFSAFF